MSTISLYGMKAPLSEKIIKILRSTHDVNPPRPKGLQRFIVGEQVVWAINRKNAERKAKLYPNEEIIGG